MNLPHTKAWWRSQAEHRFTLLRSAIAARNRYWRWLGNCWDRLDQRDAEIRRLREDIGAKEHLLVARDERIRELEERLRMAAAVTGGGAHGSSSSQVIPFRCPCCGITWAAAAWPGCTHFCLQPLNAVGVTTGRGLPTFEAPSWLPASNPPPDPAAERLRRLAAVHEAAAEFAADGHRELCPHPRYPHKACDCGWAELRAALDAVDAP